MKKLFIAVIAASFLFTSCAKKVEQNAEESTEETVPADTATTPGTHTHADGEVHQDHKPADSTATAGTHKHADGEVHQDHAKDTTKVAKPHKHPH